MRISNHSLAKPLWMVICKCGSTRHTSRKKKQSTAIATLMETFQVFLFGQKVTYIIFCKFCLMVVDGRMWKIAGQMCLYNLIKLWKKARAMSGRTKVQHNIIVGEYAAADCSAANVCVWLKIKLKKILKRKNVYSQKK